MDALLSKIETDNIPQHVAIIMDGNGRWAKKLGMIRTFGHQSAISSVKSCLEGCRDIGIKYLTLYAFSTENWKRPKKEVDFLMRLLANSVKQEKHLFFEHEVRLRTIGDISRIPAKTRVEIESLVEETKNFDKGNLTIALNYGSKFEIVNCIKKIAQKVKDNEITIDDIDETLVDKHLYTHDLPEVDLLIRTSGEQRISNFLLWQIAYSELYFTPVLWPDFRKEHLFEAVYHYQNRERRFGKTSEQLA